MHLVLPHAFSNFFSYELIQLGQFCFVSAALTFQISSFLVTCLNISIATIYTVVVIAVVNFSATSSISVCKAVIPSIFQCLCKIFLVDNFLKILKSLRSLLCHTMYTFSLNILRPVPVVHLFMRKTSCIICL